MIDKDLLQKLEAIIATGMPGGFKVVIFFLIQTLYGSEVLGNIASWFSLAQILAYFSAIGWCSLVMVRVAKGVSRQERVTEFNQIFVMGLLTLSVIVGSLVSIGMLANLEQDVIPISVFLTAWSIYQFPRHYFLALKQYRTIIVLEIILLLSTGLYIAFSPDTVLAFIIPMLIIGCFSIGLIEFRSNTPFRIVKFDCKGLEFGLNNFLSGGVSLSIIPIARQFEGEAFAGSVSLFISIIGIALLIPRAISLNQLPTLAMNFSKKEKLRLIVDTMSRQISFSNIGTVVINFVTAIILIKYMIEPSGDMILMLTFVFLIANSYISNKNLVNANVLMSAEASRIILAISGKVSLLFFGGAGGLYMAGFDGAFLMLCILICFCSLYRFIVMKKEASKYICP